MTTRKSTTRKPADKAEVSMIVRLPRELHDALRQRAQSDDRTMAATIRHAIRVYVGSGLDDAGEGRELPAVSW